MDSFWKYHSPFGGITLSAEGRALTGLWFDCQRSAGAEGPVQWLPVFDEACRWLDVYFSGRVPAFTPLMDLRGSAFRKDVWEILLGIPYGRTMSYGQVAALVARKRGQQLMSAQAVGGAVGHNPVSLIVPCHRVIGADGSLTGYAGGLDLKSRLLRLENAQIEEGLRRWDQAETKNEETRPSR